MIEFESVGKTFRNGTAAVVDLTLTVPSDSITVIVGPPGCGGTTALRMVNRLLEPTTGRILWGGEPLRSKRKTVLRRQLGHLTANGGLFPHRRVLENIGTVPALLGWTKARTERRALELLDVVGLDRGLSSRYPGQLTGGQQQRVALARALAADPPVVLMDEPFSALDPADRQELHDLLLGLQAENSKTIILVTHDIDEALRLGDSVAVLRAGGHLAQVGTPQQLLEHPADAFVEGFVGRDRGYRSLAFLPASGLTLGAVPVVRDVSSASAAPTLVVDQDARPLGWVDTARPGQLTPLGATFEVESGTLRSALDSALTSPYGLAVGVSAKGGRYAGVATSGTILAHVVGVRAEPPQESVTVPEPPREPVTLPDPTSEEEAPAQLALMASAGGAHALSREAGSADGQQTAPVEPGYPELGGEGGRDLEPVASAASAVDRAQQAGDEPSGHLLDAEGRLDERLEDRTLERVGDGAGARR